MTGPFFVLYDGLGHFGEGINVNWIKKAALRWSLGLSKNELLALEHGAGRAEVQLNRFIFGTAMRKAFELQEEEKLRLEEIDNAVADYERRQGWT